MQCVIKLELQTWYIKIIKIKKNIPLNFKSKTFHPNYSLKCLCYTHIYPHLNYFHLIRSNTHHYYLYNLDVLYKKDIRIMSNSGYCEHTQPKSSDTMNFSNLSRFNIALYTHIYKQIKSNYFDTLLPYNYPASNQNFLRIPRHEFTRFTHSLMYLGAKTWNELPIQTKRSSSLRLFKDKLKKHMLSLY